MMNNKTYLLTGSNMHNPSVQLKTAVRLIQKEIGVVMRKSAVYTTAAWGTTTQPDFLNQVLIVQSKLSPETMMETILGIEKKMGRIRTVKNAPRIIDIDILFYNKDIIKTNSLTIPHPFLQERNFVLTPLNELSPQFVHPVFKKNIHHLYLKCKDLLAVKKK